MKGRREFHLYYWWKGVIQSSIYQEEIVTVESEKEVRETLSKIIAAMKRGYNPYKYSFRVEAENGSYWVVERRPEDVASNMFTCTYYKQWNWQEGTEKMNRRELTKAICEMGAELL